MADQAIETIARAFNDLQDRLGPEFGWDVPQGHEHATFEQVRPWYIAIVEEMVRSGTIVTPDRVEELRRAWDERSSTRKPARRLFEFSTGDEIDVDRYVSLSLLEATAHFNFDRGYQRVTFGSPEEMRAEISRMRRFRDDGLAENPRELAERRAAWCRGASAVASVLGWDGDGDPIEYAKAHLAEAREVEDGEFEDGEFEARDLLEKSKGREVVLARGLLALERLLVLQVAPTEHADAGLEVINTGSALVGLERALERIEAAQAGVALAREVLG